MKAQENFERVVTEANAQIVAGYSDRMKLTDKERADIYSTNRALLTTTGLNPCEAAIFLGDRIWGIGDRGENRRVKLEA